MLGELHKHLPAKFILDKQVKSFCGQIGQQNWALVDCTLHHLLMGPNVKEVNENVGLTHQDTMVEFV